MLFLQTSLGVKRGGKTGRTGERKMWDIVLRGRGVRVRGGGGEGHAREVDKPSVAFLYVMADS